jgi:glycosyltransferase involved in cell wall biosynthesis
MIVKNEGEVIERCLASVRPFIDRWVICDTGSTDDTKEKIQKVMQGVPGLLLDRPWVDFSTNRNEAFAAAGTEGHAFVIDADDTVYGAPPKDLTADVYDLQVSMYELSFWRPQIFRLGVGIEYNCVLHEYANIPPGLTRERLATPKYLVTGGGARSRDPEKYLKDSLVLEAAYKKEPHNLRHLYYLAQSYKDAGKLQEAYDSYTLRAGLGGWAEEAWHAAYQAGNVLSWLGGDPTTDYLKAYCMRPTRAEPLHKLATWLLAQGRHDEAEVYWDAKLRIPYPEDVLFVEPACYGRNL